MRPSRRTIPCRAACACLRDLPPLPASSPRVGGLSRRRGPDAGDRAQQPPPAIQGAVAPHYSGRNWSVEWAGMSAVAPVDWARAEQVAITLSERSPAPDVYVEGWDPPIGLIERQIEDVTGLRSVGGTASV